MRYVLLSKNGITGIGECSPLHLLSIDDREDYDVYLHQFCKALSEGENIKDLDLGDFPSIRFGLETALLDLENGGRRFVFKTDFVNGKPIPINGLVWMADLDAMYTEAIAKIKEGYSCIKFKVGQHDFDAECRFLEKIRAHSDAFKLEIRLDANGGFLKDDAMQQLQDLHRFGIHSIEQPIQPKLWDDMAKLCLESKIDIALDEELIGVNVSKNGKALINHIKPQYLILKPNLIGGFSVSDEWINLSQRNHTGWWATSALESNIGLNAIAQWVSQYDTEMPLGLGTGSLFTNNISSPLAVKQQSLIYGSGDWDLALLGWTKKNPTQ
ncbi:MAG: O-succinylbenzoate synthase [bacterium]